MQFAVLICGFHYGLIIHGILEQVQASSRIKSIGTPEIPSGHVLPPDEWFEQKLDHFTPSDLRTWKQRFMTNGTFHKEGGPVFLKIGGEGLAPAEWLIQGQWITYAAQYNALCFQLEHRFYGKSHPTNDTSLKNLVYLSIEQALADIAYFITGVNQKYNLPPYTKWITFGGSYSGSLAAWARIKFPYLVHGAVSSSAPLLAKFDFYEYFDSMKESLSTVSQSCVDEIIAANKQLTLLLQNEIGRHYIEKSFKLCSSINETNGNDISNLLQTLADNLAVIVQYNNNRFSGIRNVTINTICKMMATDDTGAIDRYAALSNYILKANGDKCLDYEYDEMINKLRQTNWFNETNHNGNRQWLYQSCTEFGFFETCSKSTCLFEPNLTIDFYIQQCYDTFGKRYNQTLISNAVQRSNILHGALSVNPNNVVFVHGTIDPWHTLGITHTDQYKNYYAYLIKGTAHCADMFPSSPKDIPELVNVREKISSLIANWINPKEGVSKYKPIDDSYSFQIVLEYFQNVKLTQYL